MESLRNVKNLNMENMKINKFLYGLNPCIK
jgi:hypothetical protein